MKIRSAALVLAATAAVAGVPGLAGTASAAGTLGASGAVTDNYKASYNADPTRTELRTWLALRSIASGGVTYTPSALPAAGGMSYVAAGTGLALRGSDGSAALLTASTSSGNVAGQGSFRTAPTGEFGLLQQTLSREALRTGPVREVLTLTRGGVALATLAADYTYDAGVYGAPSTSIEHNGPGGRWYVNGVATRLDWESAAPAPAPVPTADTTAPVLSGVSVPATTASRTITIGLSASDAVGVAQARFANEDGVWSTWRAFSPSMTWTLSSTASAYKGVTSQVRDAAGNTSTAVYRKVTYRPASTGPDTTAPVLSAVALPATTTSRTVTIGLSASDAVGVAQARFANEDGVWSTWRAFSPSMTWTLSSSTNGYKGVTAQVRDAAGNTSGTIYQRTTCSCS